MSGNFAIKGGGRGVGPLMANAILNFHFDYLTPSLSKFRGGPVKKITLYHVDHSTKKGQVIVHVFGDQWYSTALQ